jgi:uncharacterized phage protein gp47/JayE
MSSYGVLSTGFVRKPIETILDEMETEQKAGLGADFDVSAQSPAGQINGSIGTQFDELWEVAEAVYSSLDPDKATGTALAAISTFSGTVKEAATKSTVTATVNLDAGKTLATGAVASVSGNPAARFVTIADATNSGGAPADISVEMEAETAGIVVANSGTLTVIDTPQTGWNTVTNALDATLGEEEETDAELRVRREQELRRAGSAAVDAIRTDVDAVADTTSVTVFENTTDVTDGDGVPPHSVEVVVRGGDADAIAQAIWDSKAGGIESHGSSSGTAVDEDGENQTIDFSRPTEVDIYIDVEVDVNDDYPATGDADIKTALAAFGQANLFTGDDVIYSQLFGIIFAISGVVDVTLLETGIAPAPAGTTNIVIGARSLALIDTGDITVVSTSI